MLKDLRIAVNLGVEQFESQEAAENSKVFTENNKKLIRNHAAMAAEELINLSAADVGQDKFLELRGRLQGEIAACNYFLNIASEAAQANNN